jgi:uracil-DNA glycosylase
MDDGARVSTTTRAPRIIGQPVPMLVPVSGPVHVLLVGEAPGPRGADKSGFPFFGDAAGKHLYQVLAGMGAVSLPDALATLPWDGARFRDAALRPVAHGVALGNAYDRCPTDDGVAFRTPTRAELEGPTNVKRLADELTRLHARGLRGIVTLGRVATRTLDVVLAQFPMPTLVCAAVPHPSAQGLLSMAPDRGKGARLADLQEAWMALCRDRIIDAGFPMAVGR